MISRLQKTSMFLVALLLRASCQPTPEAVHISLQTADVKEDITARHSKHLVADEDPESSQAVATPRDHHHDLHWYKKGIIIKQLLPFLFTAFINGVFSVMFNWFFPWKVIPPIPGRLGLGQLFGGFLPKHEPYFPPPLPFVGRR